MRLINRFDKKKDQKSICLVRYGAYGDAVQITPVIRWYYNKGWYVVLNCTERTYDILKHDPRIGEFLVQTDDEVPNDQRLLEHWKRLEKFCDKFINLSGVIEGGLLLTPSDPMYRGTKAEVDKRCNKNYFEALLEKAECTDEYGYQPELFFKESEERWAKEFTKQNDGFVVVWCLSGSAIHKVYPYAASVIEAIVEQWPNAYVVLVGEGGAKGIIDPHPRILDKCGEFGIRKSFILTKYADCVVSTETGVANAASAFPTPKVILLSHSSKENLTKYWQNCAALEPPVGCFPCHRLHYTKDSCPLEEETQFPVCVALMHPKFVADEVDKIYQLWSSTNVSSIPSN